MMEYTHDIFSKDKVLEIQYLNVIKLSIFKWEKAPLNNIKTSSVRHENFKLIFINWESFYVEIFLPKKMATLREKKVWATHTNGIIVVVVSMRMR